jgi:hypothetical protein
LSKRLYQAFPPYEARRLLRRRLEFHYVPKDGDPGGRHQCACCEPSLDCLRDQMNTCRLKLKNLRQGIAGGFGGLNHVVEVCFPPFEKSLENIHE